MLIISFYFEEKSGRGKIMPSYLTFPVKIAIV